MGYVRDPALSRLAEARWGGKAKRRAVSVALLAWNKDDYPDWRKELAGPVKRTAQAFSASDNVHESVIGWLRSEQPDIAILPNAGIAWALLRRGLPDLPETSVVASEWVDGPSFPTA